MNRQRRTIILYRCFLTNLYIQILHPEQTSDFQSFFLHSIVKWPGVLIKKENFVKLWFKRSKFEPIVDKL